LQRQKEKYTVSWVARSGPHEMAGGTDWKNIGRGETGGDILGRVA